MLKRISRGKIENEPTEKEFDYLVKQLEDSLNGLKTGQTYVLKNTTENRTLDPTTSTLADVVNALSTLLKDLQSIKMISTKVN